MFFVLLNISLCLRYLRIVTLCMLALLICSSLGSQIICAVKKHILCGGPNRLPFTVPPLIFSALNVCFFCLICKKALFHVFFFQVVGEFQCRELTFKSWSIITYNLLMFQVLGFCWIYLSMTFWLGFLTNDLFAYAWISFEVIMLTSLIIR